MKIGLFAPSMNSDLWQINMDNLTFSKSDMINVYYGGEYEIFLDRNISFSLEIGSYVKSVHAQYRDFTFADGSPIFQDIQLRLTPVEANIKLYPMGRRYRIFPFIGAGVGVYAWTYQQWGDFVNFQDNTVNQGFAETRRFAFGLNGRFGLVFRFHPRLAFSLEGKYQYLKGRLSENFQDFNSLDLGGFTANAGINIYFR
ncbi:MAG TPA: hypothetical protein VF451_08405 [Acidobacteriota bacterium]